MGLEIIALLSHLLKYAMSLRCFDGLGTATMTCMVFESIIATRGRKTRHIRQPLDSAVGHLDGAEARHVRIVAQEMRRLRSNSTVAVNFKTSFSLGVVLSDNSNALLGPW